MYPQATQLKRTNRGLQSKKEHGLPNKVCHGNVLRNKWLRIVFRPKTFRDCNIEHFGPFSKTFKTNLRFKFPHMKLTYKFLKLLFSQDVLGPW